MAHYLQILNALRRGNSVAAEIPSSSPELYSWIGIYPLLLSRDSTTQFLKIWRIKISDPSKPLYRIRLFEAEKELIDQDVWIGEEHLKNKRDFFIQGEEELFAKLSELNIDIEKLGMPSNSNYPI